MSIRIPGRRFYNRIKRWEREEWRNASRRGGRRGCFGDTNDPFPDTYHIKNCKGGKHNFGI